MLERNPCASISMLGWYVTTENAPCSWVLLDPGVPLGFLKENNACIIAFAKRVKVALDFQGSGTTNVPALYCLVDVASETIWLGRRSV